MIAADWSISLSLPNECPGIRTAPTRNYFAGQTRPRTHAVTIS